ncbi:hypothetical protein FHS21_004983 [Phyllobacterium trifolii]|uniref:Uncharacterized protein n=1 Tax=Phyllobacterium trifolii TaxID=300193 RepID=A0A839UF14_9HYPH|nr:hypothetical protein [Phyllobacterium trifolii]
MKADTALVERADLKQAQSLPKPRRGEEWSSAACELRHHIDLDFVQCASLDEGHLQFPSTEDPHIAVAETSQLPDKIIDVAAPF